MSPLPNVTGSGQDTIACITGGIAEAFYGEIPDDLFHFAESFLPDEMKRVLDSFYTLRGQ